MRILSLNSNKPTSKRDENFTDPLFHLLPQEKLRDLVINRDFSLPIPTIQSGCRLKFSIAGLPDLVCAHSL